MIYNFQNTAEQYKILIPIIQRDYAQGRSDKKTNEIRHNFLEAIYQVLAADTPKKLHLDFVYGTIKNGNFIPLDGQQRLTTLFLLYWYFSKKEGKSVSFLTRFTYETRASSREFCKKLVSSDIDFTASDLSPQIKDSRWFLAYWEYDPTINAILEMLNSIHTKFRAEEFYDRLSRITFDFFDLPKFGLDDDLYIKMNARGKQLTEFENFKAKFEKHLSTIDAKLQEEFSKKIDNNWTDFFWSYGINDKEPLIDNYFMNYFQYVTEMIHYQSSTERFPNDLNFKDIQRIYKDVDAITFLFQSLDKLPVIVKECNLIFSKYVYEKDKVCLFDEEVNIIQKVIKGRNINIQQRILLFIIIKHFVKYEAQGALKDLIRVVRNLTYRVKHRKMGKLVYTIDLAFRNIKSILSLFIPFIGKNTYEILKDSMVLSGSDITVTSFHHEIEKAALIKDNLATKTEIFQLEDYKYLKGDIQSFFSKDLNRLKFYNTTIKDLFNKESSKLIRALLTVKHPSQTDYALRISYTTEKYFFGTENNWEIILTDKSNHAFFSKFLDEYATQNFSLEKMIANYLQTNTLRDWKYYFIKYSEMTEKIGRKHLSSDKNRYMWNGGFQVEKMGGSNSNAYHVNPYLHTVGKRMEVSYYAVQYNEESWMKINDLEIYCKNDGWLIHDPQKSITGKLSSKFNLEPKKENNYLLKETDNLDRIEILEKFLKRIKKD